MQTQASNASQTQVRWEWWSGGEKTAEEGIEGLREGVGEPESD